MRKHSVRKWLHAILDLLPIFLIPVFMIYSHRHTLTDVTTVDVQYKYQSNDVQTNDDLIIGNVYSLTFDDTTADTFLGDNDYIFFKILECSSYDFTNYDSDFSLYDWVFSVESNLMRPSSIQFYISKEYFYVYCFLNESDDYFTSYYLGNPSDYNFSLDCICALNDYSIRFDITDYFSYTDFNVIDSVRVDDSTSSITDVFMDNFTHTVNTKFNFSSAFNFNDLWNWLDINLFGAQNSQVMYAIYNIIVYEFLMDVLFIIYCLFMFIVDFAESCLDRPFNVTKRGR